MNYSNPTVPTAAPNAPSATAKAIRQFTKSPLILCAIIAYTLYAGISAIQVIPSLDYLEYCFDLFEVSAFMGIAMIAALFMFIGPIIITVGLWQMYSSEGRQGAETTKAGINTYVGMFSCVLGGVLLTILTIDGAMDYFGEILEVLFMPLAYVVFNLVAVSSLRKFVDAVDTTAISKKAHTDGVTASGVLVCIYLVLTLVAYMDIQESLEDLGISLSLLTSEDSMSDIANIAHIAALVMFAIAAFVFCDAMNRAKATDDAQRASMPAEPTPALTWKCTCGHVNPGYAETCMCGTTKQAAAFQQMQTAAQPPVQPPVQTAEQATPAADHIFCSECGAKCPAQAKFCKNCGAKIL